MTTQREGSPRIQIGRAPNSLRVPAGWFITLLSCERERERETESLAAVIWVEWPLECGRKTCWVNGKREGVVINSWFVPLWRVSYELCMVRLRNNVLLPPAPLGPQKHSSYCAQIYRQVLTVIGLYFFHALWSSVCRDSSIGVGTRYGLDGLGIEYRLGERYSAPVQTGPGVRPAFYTMGTWSFSRG